MILLLMQKKHDSGGSTRKLIVRWMRFNKEVCMDHGAEDLTKENALDEILLCAKKKKLCKRVRKWK